MIINLPNWIAMFYKNIITKSVLYDHAKNTFLAIFLGYQVYVTKQ